MVAVDKRILVQILFFSFCNQRLLTLGKLFNILVLLKIGIISGIFSQVCYELYLELSILKL
jgi:hypothetical protein